MTRLVSLVASVFMLGLLAGGPTAAGTTRASLPDIEDEVMCTICGTLLELSDSPQADRERAFIRRLIAEGRTKQQIKQALVDQYGSEVLATPSGHGFDLLAWLVPGIGIAIALVLVALALRKARARTRRAGIPETDLSSADLERLDQDMSSYDL
jgi:cytochrome c-type biogenesis protein CcmH